MPRIFDNLSPGPRLPLALRSTLSSASRADFCVGYFNLRGWRYLAPVVDGWGADAGPRPPQASVDRPASEGTSDAIDWAAPRVLGHALATSDAGRDAGGPRGFDDAPSWSGVKHAAADRLRAGNDRTTSRLLRPPGSSRRGTCRDAVYAARNTPRSQTVHPAIASLRCPPSPHSPLSCPPVLLAFPLPERRSHEIPRFPPNCVSHKKGMSVQRTHALIRRHRPTQCVDEVIAQRLAVLVWRTKPGESAQGLVVVLMGRTAYLVTYRCLLVRAQ